MNPRSNVIVSATLIPIQVYLVARFAWLHNVAWTWFCAFTLIWITIMLASNVRKLADSNAQRSINLLIQSYGRRP